MKEKVTLWLPSKPIGPGSVSFKDPNLDERERERERERRRRRGR